MRIVFALFLMHCKLFAFLFGLRFDTADDGQAGATRTATSLDVGGLEDCGGFTAADFTADGVSAPTTPFKAKKFIFHDTHDGDYKLVQVMTSRKGDYYVIYPFANDEEWTISGDLKCVNGKLQGAIDFNVHGKPNPPPVDLRLRFQKSHDGSITIVFLDPTNTISQVTNQPANIWYNLQPEDFMTIQSFQNVCEIVPFMELSS